MLSFPTCLALKYNYNIGLYYIVKYYCSNFIIYITHEIFGYLFKKYLSENQFSENKTLRASQSLFRD